MPNAASTLGGVSASNNQPMPALNDPELANNYRGVVPPRTNANMNNAKLPGGAANAVKPNNMGYAGQNPLANPAQSIVLVLSMIAVSAVLTTTMMSRTTLPLVRNINVAISLKAASLQGI